MLTEISSQSQRAQVFLFAHQDDEYGVFEHVRRAVAAHDRVICVYLTTGVPVGGDSSSRDAESVRVLVGLGVHECNIFFAGRDLGVADGNLINQLAIIDDWLGGFLNALLPLARIYIPAWEGGHPDHDGLHALGVKAASQARLMNVVRQYPLYNAKGCSAPWFKVLCPLEENGSIETLRISWGNRLRDFCRMGMYPSQWKTWIGLSPFVAWHLFLRGTQSTQPVRIDRLVVRPHPGSLYYERRGFSTWDHVRRNIDACLKMACGSDSLE